MPYKKSIAQFLLISGGENVRKRENPRATKAALARFCIKILDILPIGFEAKTVVRNLTYAPIFSIMNQI